MIQFKLSWYHQSKERELLGEVVDSRSGAGKIQDETEISCDARK